jgi:DNA-binding beta-propeller fold protein YncE
MDYIFDEGIAVDSSGYIYVADSYNHRIQKFDNNGKFITKWDAIGEYGQFVYPTGIVVDSSGYVYLANRNDQYLQRFQKVTEG